MDAKPVPRVPESPAKKPAGQGGEGRPPYVPTDEARQIVARLAGLGLNQEAICLCVDNPETGKPITDKTLRKNFPYELKAGRVMTHAKVAQSLVTRALDLSHPQGATCAIWYSKAQMGWRDTVDVSVDSRTGVLVIPSNVAPTEWIASARDDAAEAIEPGTQARLVEHEDVEPTESDG